MNGQGFSREVAFSQMVINIGSDAGNDIVLRGENIADFHAMLHYENERWFIAAMDPSRLTTVNGHKLGEMAEPLQNSSVVGIGDYRLMLNLNGINTDIMIQAQSLAGDSASVQTEGFGNNILLEITNSTMTEIETGATAEFELTVTNAGPLVANMQLQLQGVPTSWVQIIPPVLNLNEGRKGVFTVRISPPRDPSAEAGYYNLHFVASSPNYQQETGIADSGLTILPYSEFIASGPTPRRLELSRRNPADVTDVVILNNSNAETTYFLRSYDDANDLFFTYEREGSSQQGQESVTIRPGNNSRLTMHIGSRKLPLFGMRSHSYHYSTNVTPSDQPGGQQSLMGEVVVKPLINTLWIILTLILLVAAAVIFFQPRIYHFDGDNGKRTLVALYGNPVRINWSVAPFASQVTLDNGSGEPQIMIKSGSQFITPTISSTYTLKAENFISKMLGITYEKTLQVLVIPQSPKVSTLHTDISNALYNQQVTLSWAVSGDISKAALAYNKQKTDLTAENYTGTLAQGYTSDTLFSLKAQNNSGYDMRSLFLNVAPDRIDLKRFTIWVRPNGIAVPNNNDTRRTSRWSALQLLTDTTNTGTIRPAVNPMPLPQTNVLSIPDNFNNVGNSQGTNPEQMALSGQTDPNTGYVYSAPTVDINNPELLVSPSLRPTVMPTAIPEAEIQPGPIVRQTAVPPTSPEAAPYNRDFSIKLIEVVEDPLSDSGYRIIDYFPDYQLQPKEQILIEWAVDGVSSVKITGLSGDALNASGGDFAYPETSITYELEAEIGQVKKVYSLPVRVAGAADDGEGSGLKCDLKANAATLKEPGSVMLSWTGGGNNRVQLVSSAKAEQDSEDAEKKKEQEAKEKGESYTKPTNPPMTGGTIGDWLQPSGFMRVNVEKQTTFVLNAYDGNGNVICTKSVDVKLEGGNDKEDISNIPGASFRIIKIADENDVSQPFYTVGQTVHYTIAMTGFPKGKEPTGSVVITDGAGSCSVTLPVNTCSFVAKKAGNLTVTAVYSGDNTYKKAQATARERVINKLPTTLEIQAAFKPGAALADVISQLKFDAENEYGLIPTGVITFTVGSGTCDLDVLTDKLTCEGEVVENPEDGYWWTITNMVLTDSNADRITAVYKGDNYFSPSTAKPVLFYKVPTKTVISDAYKPGETKADFDTTISWSFPWEEKDAVYKLVKDLKPTGTITFTPMASTSNSGSANSETSNCVYDISAKTLSCEGTPNQTISQDNILVSVREMLVTNTSDRIRAVYSGDSFFNTSSHTLQFYTIPTTTEIASAVIAPDMWITLKDVTVVPNPGPNPPTDKNMTGTLTFRSGAGSSSNTQGGENTTVGYTAVPCIFDIGKETFQNCTGEVTGTIYKESDKYQVKEMRIRMDGTPGETIMADYSGDSVYLKSSSQTVEISKTPKLDTEITIETASKNGDLIRLTAVLDPADGPTGKITFKSGSAVCNLTIDNRNSLLFEDCSGEAKYDPVSKKFFITDMVMNGTPGENIRAEYSGDVFYNKSISTPVSFERKDTKITIEPGATKTDNKINLTTVLDPAEGPTGEITFTSGSATCVLDIDDRNAPAFLEPCTGKAEFKDGKFVITDMVMDGTPGSTIRAEYSGDGAFYGSVSPEITFTSTAKIDTALVLSDASKSGDMLADFVATLSFNKESAGENTPTGTIIFTIGNDTCKLNVENNEFDCKGESTVITGPDVIEPVSPETDVKYQWKFEKVQLSDSEAKSVSAVYNGDSNFNPSAADEVEFITIETVLEITDAFKKPKSEYVDTTLNLTWDDTPPAGKLPTGTITLTSGAETCTLDISTKEFKDCSIFYRDNEDPEIEKIKLTFDDKKLTIEITDLDMGSQTGTTISAKYSGDGTFLSSSAADFTFRKIPTILKIEKALKPGSLYLNLSDLLLSWNNTESENIAPTGTIKLTIGSDTCELTFDNKPDDGDFTKFTCLETGVTEIIPSPEGPDPEETDPNKQNNKIIHWLMQKILLSNGTTADRVKADYSGDDIFDASSCDFVLFSKVNTTLKIIEKDTPRMPYKYETTYANIGGSLSWTDDPAWISLGCSDPETNCPTPTGTIKYTIRSDDPARNGDVVIGTCVLDIVKKSMDCEPGTADISDITPGMDTMDFTVIHMLLASKEADRVKLEYSGDSFYNASESTVVLFYAEDKTDTTLEIITASKTNNGIALTAKLLPAETETGTILFTSGAATCTIDISNHDEVKFEKCSGKADYKTDGTIEITEMVMNGTPGDSIYAEYSGDANYNKSTSPSYSFDKVDTTTKVEKAYKSADIRVNFESVLSWEIDENKPTGVITYTIGSDSCKLTLDPFGDPIDEDVNIETDENNKNRKQQKNFTCSDTTTKVWLYQDTDKQYRLVFNDVLLTTGSTADRVKADYAGDLLFNASSSEFALFQTIPTTLEIDKKSKTGSGLVNVDAVLSWTDEPLQAGKVPAGTIKFTMGSAVCTLDISKETPVFTDCESDPVPAPTDAAGSKTKTYKITNLKFADVTGTEIKAEYSGDGLFLASASVVKSFNKIDTTLELRNAYKSETIRAFYDAVLGWETKNTDNRKPTGTITFTIGDTCKMVFSLTNNDTEKTDVDDPYKPIEFSCSDEKTKILMSKFDFDDTSRSYHQRTWTFKDVLLAVGNSADRIKAEYSGDAAFNPSSSEFLLLDTIPTTLDVSNQVKKAVKSEETGETSILVDLKVTLGWNKKPLNGARPAGTIKLTMGSASCSLDLSKEPLEFTDCVGHVSPGGSGGGDGSTYSANMIFTITDLKIGDGSGESIKAEYSGDGYFLASASVEKSFNKIDTTLEVKDAYKSETIRAFYDAVLGWKTEKVDGQEPDNRKPTGTITFTIGDTCKMVFSLTDNDTEKTDVDDPYKPIEFSCSDDKTKILMNKDDSTDTTSHQRTWSFRDVLLAVGNSADRIKAEYSGDAVFNPSASEFLLLDTIPTTLEIPDQEKQSSGTVNLKTELTWHKEALSGKLPTGTIKLTVGQNTCTIDITLDDKEEAKPRLTDCEAGDIIFTRGTDTKVYDTVTNKGFYKMEVKGLKIGDGSGESIKAEYSGDGYYLASASVEKFFDKIDTTLEVRNAYKSETIRAFYDTVLGWETEKVDGQEPDNRKPTGTITFTIGDTCKMVFSLTDNDTAKTDVDDPYKPIEFSCSDEKTKILMRKADVDGTDSTSHQRTWSFRDVLLAVGNSADRIKAEYSGDAAFNPSTSEYLLLKTIPTTLRLSNGNKTTAGLVNIEADLSWTDPVPAGVNAAGTIKFTAGSASCSFVIPTGTLTSDLFDLSDCDGKVQIPDPVNSPNTYKITNMKIGDGTAAEIRADYSGSGMFLASESNVWSFDKLPTTLEIDKAYKPGSLRANFESLLGWTTEPGDNRKPTGTITYTIGGDSCVLTIDMNVTEPEDRVKGFTCSDKDTTVTPDSATAGLIHFEKVLLSAATADRIKAEYSGDLVFNASSSELILFQTIPTILTIDKEQRQPSGTVDLKTVLTWSDEAISGELPTGTIKLTVGQAVCTVDITLDDLSTAKPHLTDCEAANIDFTRADDTQLSTKTTDGFYNLTIEGLKIGDGSGTSIKAEYSGDGVYLTSASDEKFFNKVDTTINVEQAFKPETVRATFDSILSWDKADANGRKPTGTITFTIGADTCRLVIDPDDTDDEPPLGKYTKSFSCMTNGTLITADLTTVDDPEKFTWHLEKILLSQNNTSDRIKAEYSGDAVFNASSSNFHLFQNIPTELSVENENKTGSGLVNVDAVLRWTIDPLQAEKVPAGTIKITVGSASCTLNLSGTNPIFTDCEADPVPAPSDSADAKTKTYTITNLKIGDGTETEIKAEYSGDGLFLPSASAVKSFDKYDTELDIEKAKKAGTSYADLNTLLTWNKTEAGAKVPTGTITFTIGGDSCKLTFDDTSDGHVKEFTCMGKDATVITPSSADSASDPNKKTITWKMLNIMLSSGSTADRVKAEYSGDANFNPSTTEFVLFESIPTEVRIYRVYQDTYDSNRFFVAIQLSWTREPSEIGRLPSGTINLTLGDKVCPLSRTETDTQFHSDICPVASIYNEEEPSGNIWKFIISDLVVGKVSENIVSTEYLGDNLFQASKYEHKVDTQTEIERAHIMPDGTVDITFMQKWDQLLAGMERKEHDDNAFRPSGTFKITVGASSCTMQLKGTDDPVFTDCDVRTAKLDYVGSNIREIYPKYTIEGLKIGDGTAASIKVEYSGDDLFNKYDVEQAFKMIDTKLELDSDHTNKTNDNRVNLVAWLTWDPASAPADARPVGPVTFTIGSDSCKLDLTNGSFSCADSLTRVRIFDNSNPPQPVFDDGDESHKKWKLELSNIKLSDSNDADRVKGDFAGDKLFNPSSSETKYFTKVPTTLVINPNPYKPNDPKYANLISILSWNKENAGNHVPTGTIKYTVGGGSCELNLSTKKLSCQSASDPVRVEEITPGFSTDGYRVTIEKMLLADSSADRVTAEYSGDGVFSPSSAEAVLFKKLDTTIDILGAVHDKAAGVAEVYARIDWDEYADEGLKPTGTLKFNLGSGSCTMNLQTKRLSCVADRSGTVSADGHDYHAANMLLTDPEAKIISVEYSGDAFFNASVSQETQFNQLETRLEVTAASRGCDKNDQCFINLSGTLDWDTIGSVTGQPTGKLTIKVGNQSIVFDMEYKEKETDPFTGVIPGKHEEGGTDYTQIANQVVSYDSANRHSFQFKNLLLNGIKNVENITVEYSGDESYTYSSGTKKMDIIKINTINTLDNDYIYYENPRCQGDDCFATWFLRGQIRYDGYDDLPFEFDEKGSFKVDGSLKTEFDSVTYDETWTADAVVYEGDHWRSGNIDLSMDNWQHSTRRYYLYIRIIFPEISGTAHAYNTQATDLKRIEIQYNGDDSLYNPSNTSVYTYNPDKEEMPMRIVKLYKDKYGKKYVDIRFEGNLWTNMTDGKYYFITDSTSCVVQRTENNWDWNGGTCHINTGDVITTPQYGQGNLMIKNFSLGNPSDTFMKVIFEGNEHYYQTVAESNFDTVNTALEFDYSAKTTEIKNNLLDVYISIYFYPRPFVGYSGNHYYMPSPEGELVITAGDYTCTIEFVEDTHLGSDHYYTLKHTDCGSGVTLDPNEKYLDGSSLTFMHIQNIPVPDPGVDEVKAVYNGDTIYNKSREVTKRFENKKATEITIDVLPTNPNDILTIVRGPSNSNNVPTGQVSYTFSPSGTTCTLLITDTDVTLKDCPGGSVGEVKNLNPYGFAAFSLNTSNISGIEGDIQVTAKYSGDMVFSGSEASLSMDIKYDLELIPESTGLDTPGRLYFNTVNTNVSYPKFPERHVPDGFTHCQTYPSDSDCRPLKYEFTLSATIKTDPSAPDLTGQKLQFEGRIASGPGATECTIRRVGSGLYSCQLEHVHFTSTGEQQLSVRFPGSDSYNEKRAFYPARMNAVSLSSGLTQTTTTITAPANLNVGDTVTVTAETKSSDDSTPTRPGHMYYTYNRDTNQRGAPCIEESYGAGCQLTITEGTTEIIAEYFGDGVYAASIGAKMLSSTSALTGLGSPVSLDVTIGGGE